MTNRFALLMTAAAAFAATSAVAQPGGRETVAFTHARVLTMAGPVIEDGTILIRGGQISQVGRDLEIPENARIIDLKRATVTPGLIDVDGTLGLDLSLPPPREASADATNRAFDAFDRYDAEQIRDALRNGVTAAYLPALSRPGISGGAAVVRLKGGEDGGPWAGEVLHESAALCIDLGSGERPVERLQTFDKVRKAFRAALDHREALAAYKEELEEYEKKLKERAEKEAKEEKKAEKPAPSESPKPSNGPKPEKAPETPKPGAEVEDWGTGGLGDGERASGEPTAADGALQPEQPPEAPKEGANPDEKKPEKKEDELKKPAEPRRDPQAEMILRAIDREMPVRIRAQRTADIASALALANEFSLDLIIEGGAEAPLVAEQLKAANVPVVLGQVPGRSIFRDDQWSRKAPDGAARLSRAGVKWFVGSGIGGEPGGPDDRAASRFILLNAQLAAGSIPGGGGPDPLELVTAAAADFLGVADRIGRIKPGLAADLIVWSGDPRDPVSRVERAYVGGELLYRPPGPAGEKDEEGRP